MKRLALSALIFSAAAHADVTLPFITFHNDNSLGGANTGAVFSINSGGAELAMGSYEYPSLSDNGNRTVATYVPVTPSQSGLGSSTDDVTWKYKFSGFNNTAFRGMFCPTCSTGYKDPISVSNSEMTLPYNPTSGAFGFVGLTMSASLVDYLLAMGAGQSETVATSAYTKGGTVLASTQNNVLQKLGNYNLDNSAHLEFAVDPITGEINIKSGITGQRCTPYQHIALRGLLCDVMKYSYQGSSVAAYSGSLSLSVSKL